MSLSKKITLTAGTLFLAMSTSGFAATEIIEDGLGYNSRPTYGSIMLDTAIGRPLQGVFAAVGAVTWVATLPFSVTSSSVGESGNVLVAEPASAFFLRCLGCTPKQDATRRAYRQSVGYSNQSVTFYEGDSLEDDSPKVVVHPYQH